METKTIIAIVIYIALILIELRVFFYQRTLRKLSMKFNLSQQDISLLYPTRYMTIYRITRLKWITLIVLFIFNWKAAVACLFSYFVLVAILPEQDDYKNLLIANNTIKHVYETSQIDYTEYNLLKCAISKAIEECETGSAQSHSTED